MRLKLPARPNLSRLKKQAKALQQSVNAGNVSEAVRLEEHLPGYRAGEPLALSQAQLVIAREYGFPSWPKLKRALAQAGESAPLPGRASEKETVHVTCGDAQSQTLNECEIPGLRLPLRDLLNMGPLPVTEDMESFCRLRSAFIMGWTKLPGMELEAMVREQMKHLHVLLGADRIVLWLWPLLTHQLTLLLSLQWLTDNDFRGEIFTIDSARFPRRYDGEAMLALHQDLKPVTKTQIDEAAKAWTAIRQPSPEGVLDFVNTSANALPHLGNALLRFLEELPSSFNGLSRTEQAVLSALATAPQPPADIFRSVFNQEAFPFMGDGGLWYLIRGLIDVPSPLITTDDGRPWSYPRKTPHDPIQRLALTPAGEAVLKGDEDALTLNGCDRWWGGVHLRGGTIWRFDRAAMTVGFR